MEGVKNYIVGLELIYVYIFFPSCYQCCKIYIEKYTKSHLNTKQISDSELSKHIWKLKDENKSYTISWKTIDRGRPFNPSTKICQLCTREKYYLIYRPELCTLQSNNELGSQCCRKEKLLHSL